MLLSVANLILFVVFLRMEVQQKRDAVQKNLEEFKATNNRFMASINKKVTQGKEKHEELTTEVSDF